MIKADIKSMLPSELESAMSEMGEPQYRAKQIFSWLHRGICTFEGMTNISKPLREKLNDRYYITTPKLFAKQVSKLDNTIKYLWGLEDNNAIESIVMSYEYGNTVCISSQVGCRMGCKFCASALNGFVRNLRSSEMLDQVLFSESDSGRKISNIVLMGIGEPLDNYENVMRFLELINDASGKNIGMRHITLSTCGIYENIDKLGASKLQLTLSVSLHAADDATRTKIMPINKVCGVTRLFEVCTRYFENTGRRVTYEYAMIDGVNDTAYHANELAKRLRHTGSHINLIPLNNVIETGLKKSTNIKMFSEILTENGIKNTVRRALGGDIAASCGQLRGKLEKLG